MCLFDRAAGRRPDRKGEKAQGYTRVRPEQWGVPDRCPADDTDRNSGPSGVFVFGRIESGTACSRDFHMLFRPGMSVNDTCGNRHFSGRRGGRTAA